MNDLEGGFVSIWRKMHEWEWYDDDAIFKVFIGLLWLANYKDQQWKGITIKRGSFITSTVKLCNYFNKSKNTILRCLDCLKSTGEIIDEVVPNKYRIITVVNYDKYQSVVQNLNNKRDNSRDNKRYNRRDNSVNNCKDNSRDTTNKYNKINKGNKGVGVCAVGTHTPTPPEKEKTAGSLSATPPVGVTGEPPLTESEWRAYCRLKGKDAYEAAQLWPEYRGRLNDEAVRQLRECLKNG